MPHHTIIRTARSDPLGAGLVFCVCLLVALVALHFTEPGQQLEQRIVRTLRIAPPGPASWTTSANPSDRLTVTGLVVSYWGNPNAGYGKAATEHAETPIALVIHHTANHPIMQLVRYGHTKDGERGGSYGYHVYIDPEGRVVQGAPLSRRTNHVKPVGHVKRRLAGANVWNGNSIGVSLVGACKLKPGGAMTEACEREDITEPQEIAAMAVVHALLQRYNISCKSVYGHGELQTDRESYEGQKIARAVRSGCLAVR